MVWTRRDGSPIRWPASQTTRSPAWMVSCRGIGQTTRPDRTLTLEVPREEIVDAAVRMAVRDGCEGGFEIGEGFDAVDLAGLDQRRDASPGPAALVVSGEESVLSIQGDRPDEILDAVGVHLDASILEEGLQPVPVTVDVGELLAEAGLGRDAQALLLKPVSEGCDEGRRPRLPGREPLAGGAAADVGFHGIQLGDAAQALGGDLGAVAVKHLLQLSSGMGPAMRHAYRMTTLA